MTEGNMDLEKELRGSRLPCCREALAEIERLRAEIIDHRRTLWLIVRGQGNCTVEKHEVEDYPGDDQALLERSTDPATGDFEFHAITIDGNGRGHEQQPTT